jgi:Stress responsive A/B Barrel Domain
MITRVSLVLGIAAMLFTQSAVADIQHIVIFKYRPDVTESVKTDIARRFIKLKDIARHDGRPYIVSITGGKATSKEGFDQKMDQGFIVTFKNETDRNYWVGKPYSELMDPDHQALAKDVDPLLVRDEGGNVSGIFVFDYDDGTAK